MAAPLPSPASAGAPLRRGLRLRSRSAPPALSLEPLAPFTMAPRPPGPRTPDRAVIRFTARSYPKLSRGATPEKERRPIALPAEPLKCGVVWTRLLPTLRPTPYALRRSYSERLSKIDEHHRVKIDGQIESHLRFALSLCESAKRKRARKRSNSTALVSRPRVLAHRQHVTTLHTTHYPPGLPASRPPGYRGGALRAAWLRGRGPCAGRREALREPPGTGGGSRSHREGDRDPDRGIAIRAAGPCALSTGPLNPGPWTLDHGPLCPCASRPAPLRALELGALEPGSVERGAFRCTPRSQKPDARETSPQSRRPQTHLKPEILPPGHLAT